MRQRTAAIAGVLGLIVLLGAFVMRGREAATPSAPSDLSDSQAHPPKPEASPLPADTLVRAPGPPQPNTEKAHHGSQAPGPSAAAPDWFDWDQHQPIEGATVWPLTLGGLEDGFTEARTLLGQDCEDFIAQDDRVVFTINIINVDGKGVATIFDIERGDGGENDDYIDCQSEVIRRVAFDAPPAGGYGQVQLPINAYTAIDQHAGE